MAEEHASPVLPADVATKSDLADVATRSDLADFATKADLAHFATRADLAGFATKADLANFATKADLAFMVAELKDVLIDHKTSTLKWVFGTMLAFTGINVTAMIALLAAFH